MKVENKKEVSNNISDLFKVKKDTKNKTLSRVNNNTSSIRFKVDSKKINKSNPVTFKEKPHCLIGEDKKYSLFNQFTFVVVNLFYIIPLFVFVICYSNFNLFVRIASFIYLLIIFFYQFKFFF